MVSAIEKNNEKMGREYWGRCNPKQGGKERKGHTEMTFKQHSGSES